MHVSVNGVRLFFDVEGGESDRFNMFPELDRIRCPTRVIGGEDDPMHPIESQADIAAAEPRAVRTVRGLQTRRRARCARAGDRAAPGIHPEALD